MSVAMLSCSLANGSSKVGGDVAKVGIVAVAVAVGAAAAAAVAKVRSRARWMQVSARAGRNGSAWSRSMMGAVPVLMQLRWSVDDTTGTMRQ